MVWWRNQWKKLPSAETGSMEQSHQMCDFPIGRVPDYNSQSDLLSQAYISCSWMEISPWSYFLLCSPLGPLWLEGPSRRFILQTSASPLPSLSSSTSSSPSSLLSKPYIMKSANKGLWRAFSIGGILGFSDHFWHCLTRHPIPSLSLSIYPSTWHYTPSNPSLILSRCPLHRCTVPLPFSSMLHPKQPYPDHLAIPSPLW